MAERTSVVFSHHFDDKEAQAFFKTFGKKYMKKIYRKALRKIAYQIRDKARTLAPEDTSAMVESMVIRKPVDVKVKRGDMALGVVINEERLASKSEQPYPYYSVVEYGNRDRAADPFLRPAADILRPEVNRMLIRESLRILTEEKPRGFKEFQA